MTEAGIYHEESPPGFTRSELNAIAAENDFHPAVTQALRWFVDDGHLPYHLASINNRFAKLAMELALAAPKQTQTTNALNRLLESKDCAVRAFIAEEEDENDRIDSTGQ